jgi:hypothetical protein
MDRGKTDETDPAAIPANSANQGDGALIGLLGGELAIFVILGLGLGASARTKELVLKGLLAEQMSLFEARAKRGRGRPRKEVPNIDRERAAAVLGADDLWRDKKGEGAPTQKAAIELAIQIDAILVKAGARNTPLFGGEMTTFARLQTSVSKGLRELGEAERFSKK